MNTAKITTLPRRTPPTILVVDDDVIARCLISDELRARGFKVLEAHSAAEAIKVLGKVHVDLLLVEIYLAGALGGLDVIRQAQTYSRTTRIVLTSNQGTSASELNLGDLGTVVPKPVSIPNLLDVVSRSLNWPNAPQA
jgi:CheY-like chemotaxis protein